MSDDEYSEIKNHPLIGTQIINAASIFQDIIPIVKHHHERYDGRGYPSKLAGKDIPLYARITAIADSFDAMTSDRQYRPRMNLQEALDDILKNCDIQFDGELAKLFVTLINRDKDIIQKEMDHVFY